MSEATQNQSLEQALNKTDFGHIVFEYRKVFLALLLAILVGVLGWVIWRETSKSSALDNSVKVFEFQTNVWTQAQAGKIEAAELVKRFGELDQNVQRAPVMIPVALEMGKFLYDKGALPEAETVLSRLDGNVAHPVGAFFIGLQRAVVLEKMGNLDGAIASLENLAKNKDVLMPARVSVELGRLYLAKGEKGKAQTQLEYVIDTYPNDEQAKIAKLYQAQLAQ
jgi:predicted negative regulator of RcsB-dependent stress response